MAFIALSNYLAVHIYHIDNGLRKCIATLGLQKSYLLGPLL